MAYSTIDKATNFFNPKLYTGTGSSLSVTGVGFSPDMVWLKSRDITQPWGAYDTVRGATVRASQQGLGGDTTIDGLSSFDADGFTIGTNYQFNTNTIKQATWSWKAGTTSGISGGTLTPDSYSINTTSKFGIYKWTGTGSAATIAHGLGVVPKVIIVKRMDAPENWQVYHWLLGAENYLTLNTTNASAAQTSRWNDTEPTSTVFSIGTDTSVNASGGEYFAYVWCDVPGFFTSGKYYGNYDANGPMIYTGFRPSLIYIKCTNDTGAWLVYDNKRLGYNENQKYLEGNSDPAESNTYPLNIYSNGFKCKETSAGSDLNGNSDSYCWMAWGQTMVSSGNIVATAR